MNFGILGIKNSEIPLITLKTARQDLGLFSNNKITINESLTLTSVILQMLSHLNIRRGGEF